MAIVDIRTIELDDAAKFFHDSSTSCFDAKDVEHSDAAARTRPLEIDAVDAHHGLQVDSVSFQNPLLLFPRLDGALITNYHLCHAPTGRCA
jgi:hypothetical protein